MFQPPTLELVRVTITLFVESDDVDTVNVSLPVPEVLTSHVVLSTNEGQTNFVKAVLLFIMLGSAAMTTFESLLDDDPIGTMKW